MAIAATALDFLSDATDATTYATTGSATPAANSMLVVPIQTSQGSGADPPTPTAVSGYGLTWELVYGPDNWDNSGVTYTLTVYAALVGGSPVSGNLSLTLSGTSFSCGLNVDNITGLTGKTTAVDYFVQTGGRSLGTGTAGTATLSALASASNLSYGYACEPANEFIVQGAGFTLLNSRRHTSPNTGNCTEWALNKTSVGFTWATSGGYIVWAAEIGTAGSGISLVGDSAVGDSSAAAALLAGGTALGGASTAGDSSGAAAAIGGVAALTTSAAAGVGDGAAANLVVPTTGTDHIRAAPQFATLSGPTAIQTLLPSVQVIPFVHKIDGPIQPVSVPVVQVTPFIHTFSFISALGDSVDVTYATVTYTPSVPILSTNNVAISLIGSVKQLAVQAQHVPTLSLVGSVSSLAVRCTYSPGFSITGTP